MTARKVKVEEVRRLDVILVDDILSNYDVTWTGEDIRRRLEKAGFYICLMPSGVHESYCPTCGCEPLHGQGEKNA